MTERELCDLVRGELERAGFDVWSELAGWDLVAFATNTAMNSNLVGLGLREGDAVGIEVKLCTTWRLLQQATKNMTVRGQQIAEVEGSANPEWRVAIVKKYNQEAWTFFRLFGVPLIPASEIGARYFKLSEAILGGRRREQSKRIARPSVKVELPAGVPSPRTQTERKVQQVRIMLRLLAGETLTSREVRPWFRQWELMETGWFRKVGRSGRGSLWGLGTTSREYYYKLRPDIRWPDIIKAIQAAEPQKVEAT